MAPASTSSDRLLLSEAVLPRRWCNIAPDLPEPPPPPIHPATGAPVSPSDLSAVLAGALMEQEGTLEPWVDIPGPVLEVYGLWRPTPLARAKRLENALDTPARIYYKNEGASPTGSHKANSAVAQVSYHRQEGARRIVTDTGAGQWGAAMAFACRLFGIDLKVYMVRSSYERKPYCRSLIQLYGADVSVSPSTDTVTGRAALQQDPESKGSLGLASSEAVEEAALRADSKYAMGSLMNHVLLHQTVIGQEALAQMEALGDYPHVVIGCVGGGSNFGGLAFPFLRRSLAGGPSPRLLAVEPETFPRLTAGEYRYDHGDGAGLAPLFKMYTLGHDFQPPEIAAGGLRLHAVAPLVSAARASGLIDATAYSEATAMDAALLFARTEGLVPAPEAAYALRAAIDEAAACRRQRTARSILVGVSGSGLLDLPSYEPFLACAGR